MEHEIIKSLQQKIQAYYQEIEKIETAIEVIKRNSGPVSFKSTSDTEEKPARKTRTTKVKETAKIKPNQVISKKPISKQVIEYLSESNRFMMPAEIVDELSQRSGKKVANVQLLVNQTLSRLKKESKLVSFKPEKSRSHVWGFKEWLTDTNEPLPEFSSQASE